MTIQKEGKEIINNRKKNMKNRNTIKTMLKIANVGCLVSFCHDSLS